MALLADDAYDRIKDSITDPFHKKLKRVSTQMTQKRLSTLNKQKKPSKDTVLHTKLLLHLLLPYMERSQKDMAYNLIIDDIFSTKEEIYIMKWGVVKQFLNSNSKFILKQAKLALMAVMDTTYPREDLDQLKGYYDYYF